jgi:SnoaL-like polyketide cyclase
VSEGDRVVSRWMFRGTHRGRRVTLPGITISRFANDQIAEDWTVSDNLALIRQVGVGTGSRCRALRGWTAARRLRPARDSEQVGLGWVQGRDAEAELVAAFDREAGLLDQPASVAGEVRSSSGGTRSIGGSVGLATQASDDAGMRAIECAYGPTNRSTTTTLAMDREG